MDILYHVGLIVLIGIFFFLDNRSNSTNSLMFVLIFCLLGLFSLLNFDVEFVNYAVFNTSSMTYQTTVLNDTNLGSVTMIGFLWLVYIWFIFLSVLGFAMGKSEVNK